MAKSWLLSLLFLIIHTYYADGQLRRKLSQESPASQLPNVDVELIIRSGEGCGGTKPVMDIYKSNAVEDGVGAPTVLLLPDGEYEHLITDSIEIAGSQYIAAGYTLAVLYYRLPLSPTDAEDDEHLVCNDPRETEKDLNAAMDVLHKNAAEYRVNPNQIVFSGFSAGGHLAALHSARCSRRGSCPKAQVLHYPYLDAGAMIFCSEVGTKYREQMDFNDCHPTYLVDRGVPPTIVYHAKQDELVQTRQMTDYVTALMNHNVPHEYYEAPSGGHYLVSFDEVTTGGSFTATANYASLIEHALALPDAQCNRCTDNPSQALYDEGLVCNSPEIVSRVESACSAPHWNRRGYCRQTCFNLGKAYDGEVCCDSAVAAVEPSVEKEEVAPNSPAVSSNTMCTPCYDNLSQEMIQNHLTCADSEEDIQTKCRDDEYWTLNRLCQATCYLVGRGYDGDECCEAISMWRL